MPRKPRIEFSGAFYHVVSRGNQRQQIFRDRSDFLKFLELLALYKRRYAYSLYGYVLMSNHVHLLIETENIPLSKILQGINQSYTMYFNRKYRTVGHLFQGRYKAIVCDRDFYLLALVKYIHLNPIRANLARRLEAYPWSSHRAYVGERTAAAFVDTDLILRMFSENKIKARTQYRSFMNGGPFMKSEEVYATVDQRIQGDEKFIEQVRKKYGGEINKEHHQKQAYTLSSIARAIEEGYGLSVEKLRSSSKKKAIMLARRVFSAVARECGHKGKEIAACLNKEPSSVTKYIHGEDVRLRVEEVMKEVSKGE